MKKIVRLTESDLTRIVRRVLNEQGIFNFLSGDSTPAKATKEILNFCVSYRSPSGYSVDTAKVSRIADDISNSISGLGTDETQIYDAIKQLSDLAELCSLTSIYKRKFGTELFSDLSNDLTGGEFRPISGHIAMLKNPNQTTRQTNQTTNVRPTNQTGKVPPQPTTNTTQRRPVR